MDYTDDTRLDSLKLTQKTSQTLISPYPLRPLRFDSPTTNHLLPMKYLRYLVLSISISILVGLTGNGGKAVGALPPPEDIPEEVLRTQIITEARSPIDGKRVSAAEYTQLQTQLQTSPPPTLSSPIREQVFMLRIRKVLLQVFPFLNI